MTSHELLINIIGSTVLNIVPFPSAPIAPSGILGSKFGYAIRLPEFGETVQTLMKEKGAKIPDLLLVNEKENLLIVVECKSEFTFEIEERLSKQLEFYSSGDFRAIWKEIFPNLNRLEIWVVTYRGLSGKIADFIRDYVKIGEPVSLVVIEVELRKAKEEAFLQKVYGTHLDAKLNEQMGRDGLITSLPRTELLVDPTLAAGERVFRIGRRILSFMAATYITEQERIITTEAFRERHPDAIMTDRELKKCLRYLTKLVPEIGQYNSTTGEILLARRPRLDKIKAKLESIQAMTEEDLKVELSRIGKKEKGIVTLKSLKPQKTTLERWLPNKSASHASCLQSFLHPTTTLEKNTLWVSSLTDMDNQIYAKLGEKDSCCNILCHTFEGEV